MKDFGILIKTLRKKAALTQKELADKLGIDDSNISKWECNKNLPDVSIFPKIANILNVSCDELLHPTETLKKMSQLPEDNTSPMCNNVILISDNDQASESPTTSKNVTSPKKLFAPKRVLLLCISVIVLVISISIYSYSQKFRFIEARTNIMTDYGPAYELVFYQPNKLPDETYTKHADKLAESWRDGEYTDCTEDVFIISYYSSLEDIDSWNDVFFRCYYFNYSSQ